MSDATNPAVVQDAQQYDWHKIVDTARNMILGRVADDLAAHFERLEAERDALLAERTLVDIVFDGPPSHESGRFIDVENMSGASVGIGEWIDRGNGYWALRIPTTTPRG